MLKKISYKNITIKQAENLIKSGYFTEIICDGDNKTIGVAEKEYIEAEKKMRKMLDDIMKPVAEAFEGIAKVADITKKIVDGVFKVINSNWNKKISKKKFIKLLQSNGIQRNDINKIVQGNKEKYTYLRYYDIVTKFKKQNNKT